MGLPPSKRFELTTLRAFGSPKIGFVLNFSDLKFTGDRLLAQELVALCQLGLMCCQ
jgi:hypothetical protein